MITLPQLKALAKQNKIPYKNGTIWKKRYEIKVV